MIPRQPPLPRTVPARKHAKAAGFTLLEVLVAVVILGLAYVAILQSFSLALRNIDRLRERRAFYLTELLAFEEELAAREQEETLEDLPAGEILTEGQIYNLVLITSEDGTFVTARLEKRQ
ncbi:MAG: type II secretion system protein [Thermodesulfobacteriota bacterium]